MPATTLTRPGRRSDAIPELQNGDRLTRDEFERRYAPMTWVKKAELIEGVVYIGSLVTTDDHGEPRAWLVGWLAAYAATRRETQIGDNATVRLDEKNEPQPDVFLRLRVGGTSAKPGKYVEGAPELVVEVAASSVSIDLHAKKEAYRRNGVQEYLVWRTMDGEVDWFVLDGGEYVRLEPDTAGVIESRVFPGLRLPVEALLDGNVATVLAAVAPRP
jgi:Uma2 family endonuclease